MSRTGASHVFEEEEMWTNQGLWLHGWLETEAVQKQGQNQRSDSVNRSFVFVMHD